MENNACKNLRKIVIITEKFTKFLQHKRVESVINQRNRIKSREIMKTYYSFEIQLMNDDFCRFDLSIPELNKIFEIPESLWRKCSLPRGCIRETLSRDFLSENFVVKI